MFDFSKLGDMSKLASQAKQIQEKQECFQRESLELLKKISSQLDQAMVLLKEKR
ncbi:hypothetical protein ACFL0P_00240 [Candidatus Omnitrophota bacterium]